MAKSSRVKNLKTLKKQKNFSTQLKIFLLFTWDLSNDEHGGDCHVALVTKLPDNWHQSVKDGSNNKKKKIFERKIKICL